MRQRSATELANVNCTHEQITAQYKHAAKTVDRLRNADGVTRASYMLMRDYRLTLDCLGLIRVWLTSIP